MRLFCLLALAALAGIGGNALAHGPHGHAAPVAVEQPGPAVLGDERSAPGHQSSRIETARIIPGAQMPSHCPSGPGLGCGCGNAACSGSAAIVVHGPAVAFALAGARADSRPAAPDSAPARTFLLVSAPPRAPPFPSEL